MLGIGYDDETRKVQFANSWGTGWGDKGYGDLDYDFFGPTEDSDILSESVVCALSPYTLRLHPNQQLEVPAPPPSTSSRRVRRSDLRPIAWPPPGGFLSMPIGRPGEPLPQPPAACTLRKRCPPIVDQGGLGSCEAHAFTSALRFLHIRDGIDEPLSRLFVHWCLTNWMPELNEIAGVVVLQQYGACLESLWPYDDKKAGEKPSQEAFDDAAKRKLKLVMQVPTLRGMKLSIAAGFPVVMALATRCAFDEHGNMSSAVMKSGSFPGPPPVWPAGYCPMATIDHIVLAIGYDDAKGKVIIENSWGPDWGDGGYGDVDYACFGPTQDSTPDKNSCAWLGLTLRAQADELENVWILEGKPSPTDRSD